MTIVEMQTHIAAAEKILREKNILEKIVFLEEKTLAENFWNDPQEAQKISTQLAQLKKISFPWENIKNSLGNFLELKEFLSPEETEMELLQIENKIKSAQIELFLSGEYDNFNAIVSITVGAGGVDANDWTEMVLKMLLKYCEQKNWKTEILDIQNAEIAGIKGATFRVFSGDHIFGYLKSENGTHRLVRPSPFNSKGTRETSFAHVEIIPEIEEENYLQIEEKDIRIDTFRAQGAGGQHVNTTDSAIRITHMPTGIVVQCQNERSQIQNRAAAMKVLLSKLAEKQRIENEAKRNSLKSEKTQASFGGGHIRSYVLDDRYVKDVRTGYKTSQVEKILEGELDECIESFIFLSS